MNNEPMWDDCKVAFSVEDDEPVWRHLRSFGGESAHLLPNGWELVETDCAGARSVAVFRVGVVPTIEDGATVKNLLEDLK